MFFVLSKILDVGLAPLTWALVLLVAAAVLVLRRRARAGAAAFVAGLAILCVFSSEPVANALWRALETPVLSTARDGVTYDAVIVLSGLVDDGPTDAHGQPAYNDDVERLLSAYQLLRDGRARHVLLSGGSGRLGGGLIEADVLARQLEAWGIDPRRIVEERDSRNTHENAVDSARVVAKEGWSSLLLVTSAFHMPRALGCFVRAGLHPDVLSVDFRSSKHAHDWFPRAGALAASSAALHEFAGRATYRLAGYD